MTLDDVRNKAAAFGIFLGYEHGLNGKGSVEIRLYKKNAPPTPADPMEGALHWFDRVDITHLGADEAAIAVAVDALVTKAGR